MNHGTTERDLPYVEDQRDPLLGNDRRCKTCGRIVMGPRMTETGMTYGTTPQSNRRPGVGQVPEHRYESHRYAPGHTLFPKVSRLDIPGG